MENSTVELWWDGSEFVLKKVDDHFLYRVVDQPGDWQDGLPEGVVLADAHALFNDRL